MKLAERTDFGLRVLIVLAAKGSRCTVPELAQGLAAPVSHLSKVVQALQKGGWVGTSRGHGGGAELIVAPEHIRVGDVVRALEPGFDLAACFRDGGDCPLDDHCRLAGVLRNAQRAFLAELERVSVADLVRGRSRQVLQLTVQASLA